MMRKIKVMTRVIVVMIAVAMIVDRMMKIAAPIVMTTTVEIMIARTVVMIGVNPLLIEKMKMQMQIYSMRNMTVMWTIMIKTLKTMQKLTGGAILIATNTD